MKLYFCFIYCSFPVFEKDRAVYLQFTFSSQIGFCYARDSFLPNFVQLEFAALLFQFARTNQRKRGYLLYEISVRDKLVRDDDTV